MDEVVRMVAQRAGISESQARTAVETVAGFLKQRLPAPLAGQLDGLLGGGAAGGGIGGAAGGVGDALKGLGGMFGGK